MATENRCAKAHHPDYDWVFYTTYHCKCGEDINIWTATAHKDHKSIFWHVEHAGQCLAERMVDFGVPGPFEAGVLTGEIIEVLGELDTDYGEVHGFGVL